MPAWCQAWSACWTADPTELDESLHAMPVRGVGLQQCRQTSVIDRVTGEGVADVVRDVRIAEAHRIGITEHPEPDLGAGPHPDAGQRAQAPVQLGRSAAGCPFQGWGYLCRAPDRRRAAAVDPHLQPLPGWHLEQLPRSGRQPKP